jgi:hypothetical protein
MRHPLVLKATAAVCFSIVLTSASALAQDLRSCESYGFWKTGTQCKNAKGQICTVRGIVNKKTQLDCSK